jgi:hypothetical protein
MLYSQPKDSTISVEISVRSVKVIVQAVKAACNVRVDGKWFDLDSDIETSVHLPE